MSQDVYYYLTHLSVVTEISLVRLKMGAIEIPSGTFMLYSS